ncbi:MAG: 3-deoxy-8-phosphooctulonate synthase [Elusimicrobia bacterium CG1_02_37_114]|nr:MAG: 3-deoxy-8-phosphooctulonate synthase [Elusimicrobia bacterium CG1_02_37_114]PIV53739.1 MAG: 3-deoxy-8-phosphooctulonate synthase [Elusimicrobia bacterium CG02_land_8_20_14_3_00_37_13]PIZ13526.1 MAG: 3-deoxy-8-phosphooctulonate synthase [Elusimicrobia bacterium CG_4_10_14_0_8_um_filter_37_32]
MGNVIKINNIKIGEGEPLVLIAGPCVIESEELTLNTAKKIKEITARVGIPYIFKSSYDKSNRSSVDYYRGPGIKQGLKILERIKKEVGVPVLSDVHCQTEIEEASRVLDVIQIPAYLCQQTSLVVWAAKTGKVINIKKGQFLAPWDMKKICKKAESTGNKNIILTERGTCLGYNNLVCDMRSIPLMQKIGYPVIVDITHILRMPGPPSTESSGGQPEFIAVLARAAVACGCDGLFLEVHPEPQKALCDASSMLNLEELEELLISVKKISEIVRK